MRGEASIFFWRNAKNEGVDFVVREGLAVTQLIQVCRNVSDPKTRVREVRALLKAGAELDCANRIILTADEDKEGESEWFGTKGTIRYMPMADWLVAQD